MIDAFGTATSESKLSETLWQAMIPNYRLPAYRSSFGTVVKFYSGSARTGADSGQAFAVGFRDGLVTFMVLSVGD